MTCSGNFISEQAGFAKLQQIEFEPMTSNPQGESYQRVTKTPSVPFAQTLASESQKGSDLARVMGLWSGMSEADGEAASRDGRDVSGPPLTLVCGALPHRPDSQKKPQ